jgi:hypothetical protein
LEAIFFSFTKKIDPSLRLVEIKPCTMRRNFQNIVVYVNGKKHTVPPFRTEAGVSVLDYLHELGLKSSKRVCEEGGCGACTVMRSRFDHETGMPTFEHVCFLACALERAFWCMFEVFPPLKELLFACALERTS